MQKNEDQSKDNKQSEENEEIEIKQSADLDQFDQVLNNFDEAPLNLTNEDKKDDEEEDPQMMAKIKDQYEKFMKQMQGGLGGGDEEDDKEDFNMDNLGNMLGNLMKGLTEQMGEGGQEAEQFTKKFADMFKNINEDNVEDAATQLLNEFMDKSLLLEPMQQTKSNYEQYFTKCKNSQVDCSKEDMENYEKQYQIVNKILHILESDAGNKAEMIKLFEQMQKYGNPPEGIAPHHTGFL